MPARARAHTFHRGEQPFARGVVLAPEAPDERIADVGAGDGRAIGELETRSQAERPRQAVARAAERVRERGHHTTGAVHIEETSRELPLEHLAERIRRTVRI